MSALACGQQLTFDGKENKCKPKLPIRGLRSASQSQSHCRGGQFFTKLWQYVRRKGVGFGTLRVKQEFSAKAKAQAAKKGVAKVQPKGLKKAKAG